MKIIVAVIVYTRFHNIQRWIRVWNKSIHDSADLIIIHNYDNENEIERFKNICDENKIGYVPRKNIGYDIGAMQDCFMERFYLPDWNYLLWCTDDVIPMQKDFITPFIENMKPGIGIAAMQISKEKTPHVRTTGFMIPKEVSRIIKFPADPVTTKNHCYQFEYSGGNGTLTNQVRNMGLDCVQVAPLLKSPLYDMGWPMRNNKVLKDKDRFDRITEHQKIFNDL